MAVAETQLYAKVSNRHRSRSTSVLLESLLAKGFPAHIAQKALAATGQKTVEEAAKWLHSHCNDPSLEDPIPQEYALYLCPTGCLHNYLLEFWKESKRQCGKNRAHEVFPHITLCDFFTCEDQKVELLYDTLKRVGESFSLRFPPSISLLLHSSTSYLGFFIDDKHANILKEFAQAFSSEASAVADCHVKPCLKQLHLTLSHRFYPHHQKTLEQLAKCINPEETCQWVAALYSRDMRFVHYQTLRALFQYKPQNIDELMINAGDFIYVDPTQQSEVSEGWVIGTSHRTGCRGFLPENYTERANESDTWVKHREYVFVTASRLFTQTENEPNVRTNGEVQSPRMSRSITKVLSLQISQNATPRRSVLVMRHGERVDQVFGKSWLQQCLTADGKYYRADLNFPSTLPKRKDSMKHFEYDPPLSCCGIFQSRLIGEALLDQEVTVSYVYSSPALRCIQTAQHILQGLKLDQKVKIRVEPGLFEWTKWEASRVIPSFMTVTELIEASYKIDTSYRCNFPLSSLVPSESYEEYVSRSSVVIKQIINACPSKGVILIVGHGSSLVSFTRPLIGLPNRDSKDFAQVIRKIPSLGMCFCEELTEENKWQMVNPPVKTLTHGANAAFNWRNGIVED
ncbi:ubiquitin-associated and SH3 domain-containing protein A isoform X1 [Melopsittacus undulatus]|uniref:ubiquitin-associated and SH3 domain-containing protein A isoform X1 n=1 Tax=Melopsittacus undulatus TaxID=13146 RepID=UPI0012435F58|nr:ubiquitin-associated and SH3 domain-containing protein A isoform X1 [Melopsittacus undulatus]